MAHGGAGRSTAIVLFTDLVGSTDLRSRLGEDRAEELRHQHEALVSRAVEASRGHLVKNLGDGFMATFVGASDAVGAAVAIQQAIGRHNRSSAASLEVRIGISAGDVVFEEDDCFGTPVIEAARLCGVAAGGQILASDLVRLLAGSGSGHEFTPVGAINLKGLPAPVAACGVVWEPLAVSAVPLPTLLTDLGLFVGRDDELERLGQLWKEAATGGRHVVLLAGEPGVGKTRLAAELAGSVHDEGATVLAGRCDENLGVPYQPFVEALRHFVDHTPLGELRDRLGRYGGELTRLLPELADRVPDLRSPLQSDPETERYRLFDGVAAWLSAVSAEEPLLLVLDDLQWAAKPTLLLLRHVVRAAGVGWLLILGTYRDTELTHDHPLVELVADLRGASAVERLPISGLDDVAVAAIVEQASGQTLDEDGVALARAIYQETEGNPFFVRQLLRHLAETNAVEREGDGWRARVPVDQFRIPEGVRDVVGRRLARLSEQANQALRVAAVVGAEFEAGLVQAAGELAESALLAALDEAIQARLVTEVSPTRFQFAHALVRGTLYESLSGPRKVALHRHVAEAIEALHAGQLENYLPALAHHWAKASAPADTARAVAYAQRAGDRALVQLAHDEAATYYGQALELLSFDGGDEGQRVELLISLGDAQRRAGDPAHRETLLEATRLAQRRGDGNALARAALANTRGMYWSSAGSVDPERVAALESALSAVGEEPTAVRARLLATLGVELVWTPDRARRLRLSDESLQIARSLGDAATLAHVLMTRAWTINAADTVAERRANIAELLSLADELGDPMVEFIAHFLRVRVTLESGEVEDGDRHLRRARTLADELGQPTLRFTVRWVSVGDLVRAGRIDEADRIALEAFEIGEASGQPDARFVFLIQRAVIRFGQGRLGELEPELSAMSALFPSVPGAAALVAAAYCQRGAEAEARSPFDRLAAVSFELPKDPLWLGFLTMAADVACRLGDHRSASTLYDLLRPYTEVFPVLSAVSTGSTDHYLGMLAVVTGRAADAEEHFRAAAATHERMQAPIWLARTRLEWARMLLARRQPGDAERARELLGQALATARELGLAHIERGAVQLLRSW